MTSQKISFKQISHSKCSLNSILIVRLGPSQRIQKSNFAKNKNLKIFTGSWYLGLWVVSLGCVNVEKGRWFGSPMLALNTRSHRKWILASKCNPPVWHM
jgi:hypothetical protein